MCEKVVNSHTKEVFDMDQLAKPNHKPGTARMLSIIPGLGQFYNGQLIKGILFLAIATIYSKKVKK